MANDTYWLTYLVQQVNAGEISDENGKMKLTTTKKNV